jgi:hypothetical protein
MPMEWVGNKNTCQWVVGNKTHANKHEWVGMGKFKQQLLEFCQERKSLILEFREPIPTSP